MVGFAPPSKPVTLTLFKSAVSDQIGTTSFDRTAMRHPYRLHLGWRDTATELRTERPELRNALAHIYRPFVTDKSVGRDSEATVLPSVNCWRASLNGKDYQYTDFEDAVVALEFEIERKLLADPRHGPMLHAVAWVCQALPPD